MGLLQKLLPTRGGIRVEGSTSTGSPAIPPDGWKCPAEQPVHRSRSTSAGAAGSVQSDVRATLAALDCLVLTPPDKLGTKGRKAGILSLASVSSPVSAGAAGGPADRRPRRGDERHRYRDRDPLPASPEVRRGRTAFVVAHRLNTIEEGGSGAGAGPGKIVERGTLTTCCSGAGLRAYTEFTGQPH